MFKAAFFDLDGTLVNSLYDLAASTNHIITKYGFNKREVDEFKYFVGDGIPKMLQRAIGEEIEAETFEKIKNEFLQYYAEHCADETCAYEGIVGLLMFLKSKGVKLDVELTAEDLKELANQFKAEYKAKIGTDFPSDPKEQLIGAVKAVFRSWDNPRANVYRRDNDIPYSWGTAVNVQMMAFGNMGDDCGTGVAFTRDPATGEPGLMGEFLVNAQGEDVVAGVRTPLNIDMMAEAFPDAYAHFVKIAELLEKHYKDVQDMEFTIERDKLYMLQTRNGKRTAAAAVKIAVDMVEECLIDKETAITRIEPKQIDQLLHPMFEKEELDKANSIAAGLPASPGAATGKVVFTAERAKELAENGEKETVSFRTSSEKIEMTPTTENTFYNIDNSFSSSENLSYNDEKQYVIITIPEIVGENVFECNNTTTPISEDVNYIIEKTKKDNYTFKQLFEKFPFLLKIKL